MADERLTDLDAVLIGETADAYKLDAGDVQAWVPKSQVEDNGDGTFTMPEWLAIHRKFV